VPPLVPVAPPPHLPQMGCPHPRSRRVGASAAPASPPSLRAAAKPTAAPSVAAEAAAAAAAAVEEASAGGGSALKHHAHARGAGRSAAAAATAQPSLRQRPTTDPPTAGACARRRADGRRRRSTAAATVAAATATATTASSHTPRPHRCRWRRRRPRCRRCRLATARRRLRARRLRHPHARTSAATPVWPSAAVAADNPAPSPSTLASSAAVARRSVAAVVRPPSAASAARCDAGYQGGCARGGRAASTAAAAAARPAVAAPVTDAPWPSVAATARSTARAAATVGATDARRGHRGRPMATADGGGGWWSAREGGGGGARGRWIVGAPQPLCDGRRRAAVGTQAGGRGRAGTSAGRARARATPGAGARSGARRRRRGTRAGGSSWRRGPHRAARRGLGAPPNGVRAPGRRCGRVRAPCQGGGGMAGAPKARHAPLRRRPRVGDPPVGMGGTAMVRCCPVEMANISGVARVSRPAGGVHLSTLGELLYARVPGRIDVASRATARLGRWERHLCPAGRGRPTPPRRWPPSPKRRHQSDGARGAAARPRPHRPAVGAAAPPVAAPRAARAGGRAGGRAWPRGRSATPRRPRRGAAAGRAAAASAAARAACAAARAAPVAAKATCRWGVGRVGGGGGRPADATPACAHPRLPSRCGVRLPWRRPRVLWPLPPCVLCGGQTQPSWGSPSHFASGIQRLAPPRPSAAIPTPGHHGRTNVGTLTAPTVAPPPPHWGVSLCRCADRFPCVSARPPARTDPLQAPRQKVKTPCAPALRSRALKKDEARRGGVMSATDVPSAPRTSGPERGSADECAAASVGGYPVGPHAARRPSYGPWRRQRAPAGGPSATRRAKGATVASVGVWGRRTAVRRARTLGRHRRRRCGRGRAVAGGGERPRPTAARDRSGRPLTERGGGAFARVGTGRPGDWGAPTPPPALCAPHPPSGAGAQGGGRPPRGAPVERSWPPPPPTTAERGAAEHAAAGGCVASSTAPLPPAPPPPATAYSTAAGSAAVAAAGDRLATQGPVGQQAVCVWYNNE